MANRFNVTRNVELIERIVGVTEELEDIVAISQGKKISDVGFDILRTRLGRRVAKTNIHPFFLDVYRLFTLQGILKGGMAYSIYSTAKKIAYIFPVKDVKELINLLRQLKLGAVKVIAFSEESVVIRMYSDVTTRGISNLKRPICYFEAGFLAGMLEKIMRTKVDLQETKCRATNHPFCQFELVKLKDTKQKPYSSIPFFPTDLYSEENIRLLTTLASHSISAIENALLFEKTKRQAVMDGLTQVYNYRYFHQVIRVEVKRSERHKMPLSLIMVDIDDFKKYNDIYGHQKGDEILKMVATLFMENVREIDIVARYGGDEMVIILPHTDSKGAGVVARRLKNKIYNEKKFRRKKLRLSVSQGVVTYEPKRSRYLDAKDIIAKADKALFMAKKEGKSKIVFAVI